MSNSTKSQQLGMPFGTATGKLRKLVLFGLLVKYNENICYRCAAKILSAEDLSMDHKLPWFGAGNELFWDVKNIAFSHVSCNSAAVRRVEGNSGRKPFESPEGHTYCIGCKTHKPINRFWKSDGKKARRGFYMRCKDCSNSGNGRRA